MQQYTIHRATTTPALDGAWNGPAWNQVPALDICHFHEHSSDHRPVTRAKLLYNDAGIHVIFRIEDCYVRSAELNRNGSVCLDSCVEFFTEPVAGRGYFNFEVNAGGTLLLHYNALSATIRYDPVELDERRLDMVKIYHSLPTKIDPEIIEPVTWVLEFFAPYTVFESFVGPVPFGEGTIWRVNLCKCGDNTSHPHWAMWNVIPGPLNFHTPDSSPRSRSPDRCPDSTVLKWIVSAALNNFVETVRKNSTPYLGGIWGEAESQPNMDPPRNPPYRRRTSQAPAPQLIYGAELCQRNTMTSDPNRVAACY